MTDGKRGDDGFHAAPPVQLLKNRPGIVVSHLFSEGVTSGEIQHREVKGANIFSHDGLKGTGILNMVKRALGDVFLGVADQERLTQ
ncbi:MAG TPA: hypothetical protein VK857_00010 [Desulforhopalus sp.]|nr:hypothetical protein [Desulforhopalus sp.]